MGSWFNSDGLNLKFGTTKTVATTAGEFKTWGELREIEVKIDISTLTTSAAIINDVTFFPKGVFLEEVTVEVQTAVATITSVSVGLMQSNDRTTTIADDAILAAEVQATLGTAGNKVTYVTGTSKAGSKVGTIPIAAAAVFAGYLTAKIAGSAGTGILYVRIKYRKP
jgi:hypothetical protein